MREMETMNRKLIRPTLAEIKEHRSQQTGASSKKRVPPDQTNAESYYYLKQMAAKTPLVVTLSDGEEIHGVLEWYDKHCIKVHRNTGPNLLIPKHNIKYISKAFEDSESLEGEERVIT